MRRRWTRPTSWGSRRLLPRAWLSGRRAFSSSRGPSCSGELAPFRGEKYTATVKVTTSYKFLQILFAILLTILTIFAGCTCSWRAVVKAFRIRVVRIKLDGAGFGPVKSELAFGDFSEASLQRHLGMGFGVPSEDA
jgi:hypothetical protein